jgi:hypothetical protein
MPRVRAPYTATPKLERELARTGTVSLDGGRYRATVAAIVTLSYFEAWTESQPFVYGRPASTLQAALDNLEAAVREAEAERRSA